MRSSRAASIFFALLMSSRLAAAAGNVTVGVNVQAENRFDLARQANIGWARVSCYWKDTEIADNQFDFTCADSTVNAARAQGLKVLYILSGVPVWAGGGSNANIPPTDINIWIDFVDKVSAHLSGRVEAYEVWNEPDLVNSGWGIGWNQNITTPPLYVDYYAAAKTAIHANDFPFGPAALVVGPALSGGQNSRTGTIFSQFQSHFQTLEVVSVHQNAADSTGASTAADMLYTNKLLPLKTYNPANRLKPVWVTEFGWASNSIGENEQRRRIKNFLIYLGGARQVLAPFNIKQAFIYKLVSCGEAKGIYHCPPPDIPKLVVTQFLQTLPFPATVSPSIPIE